MNVKTWKSEFIHWIIIEPEISEVREYGIMLKTISFYKNGKLHNIEFPAKIIYNRDETVLSFKYYDNGLLHRDPYNGIDQPAVIRYPTENTLGSVAYYKYDKVDRIPNNLPAVIAFYDSHFKIICAKQYCKNGKFHRDSINGVDKPAITIYRTDGKILKVEFYIDGVNFISQSYKLSR